MTGMGHHLDIDFASYHVLADYHLLLDISWLPVI